MMNYDNGDSVRCSASFTDSAGTPVDPSVVRFTVKTPAGVSTSYLYGTDASFIRDSAGHYHVDVDANADGYWTYRFYSTGTGQSAAESGFFVTSNFV